jgi:hypothetical protein
MYACTHVCGSVPTCPCLAYACRYACMTCTHATHAGHARANRQHALRCERRHRERENEQERRERGREKERPRETSPQPYGRCRPNPHLPPTASCVCAPVERFGLRTYSLQLTAPSSRVLLCNPSLPAFALGARRPCALMTFCLSHLPTLRLRLSALSEAPPVSLSVPPLFLVLLCFEPSYFFPSTPRNSQATEGQRERD